jgi:phenylpropionate dioxygenase-like ring-hydroxylating dioxygenase large terminal subunit
MTSTHENGHTSIDELIAAHKPGYSLDQRFYVDPDIFELELERIVNRNWILAGHQSQLPNAGDFKVMKVGRESVIMVRGQDGRIRAFANVCRHRGSLVCLESRGNTRKFTCPYHGWVYDTEGRLIGARDMPEGFDRSTHGLLTVSCELIHGLVFICLSDYPPSLENCRKELAEPMAMFDFPNLKVAAYKEYAIPANWKLSIENYQECYHCATAHPDYARMHTLMLDRRKRERVQGSMKARMEACGLRDFYIDRIDTAARPGEIGYGYSRTALFDGYRTGSRDGSPVAPLLGSLTDYDGGASDFSFGAFSFLLAYSDHVVAYVFTPVDKDNSRCDIYWLVRGDAEEGKDYDVEELTWLWDVTTEADKTIIVNNFKGVRSRFYRPGPFSGMERAEKTYVDWLLQELARP